MAANSDRLNLIGWAYELTRGDIVGDREVTEVDDPDRPAPEAAPMGPGKVTVTYDSGDPDQLDRMASVTFTRQASVVQRWMAERFPTEDA